MQFLLDEDTFVDEIGHQTRLHVAQKLANILKTVRSKKSQLINTHTRLTTLPVHAIRQRSRQNVCCTCL